MKRNNWKKCVTAGAACLLLLVTACGREETKGFLMEDITPQEIDTSEEITALYRNGSLYLLNAGRLYRMSPDGRNIQEIALHRDSDREILSLAMDAEGNYYLLEKETAEPLGFFTEEEEVYPVLGGRFRFFLTGESSFEPVAPGDEAPGDAGPTSPEMDDGSYVESAGDPNYGPWMEDGSGTDTEESTDGPWNDPDLENSEDDPNYGPWNDDGTMGEESDPSGDGPWNDPDAEPDDSGGPDSEMNSDTPQTPAAGSGSNASAGSAGTTSSAGGSQTGGSGAPSLSTGAGSAGSSTRGNTGSTTQDSSATGASSGASTGASTGAGTGASGVPGGAEGASDNSGEIPTRPDGLPAFLPILPEEDEDPAEAAGGTLLVCYDAQGSTVWETQVASEQGTIAYAEDAQCILVYGDDAEWTFHAGDGSQAQSGSVSDSTAVLTAADLSEEERAAAGEDIDVLIDMQEQGRLIIKTDADGRSTLYRLYREA